MKHYLWFILLFYVIISSCDRNKSQLDVPVSEEKPTALQGYKDEPGGFRDLKWGSSLLFSEFQRLPDAKLKTDDTIYNLSTYDECLHFDGSSPQLYTKPNDKLMFGDAKISRIRYFTCRSQLYRVIIYGDDYNSFTTIKDALTLKFGPPTEEENPVTPDNYKSLENRNFFEQYRWNGSKTNISLHYWHIPLREQLRLPVSSSKLRLAFTSADFEKKTQNRRSEFQEQQKENKARAAAKDF